MPKIVHSRIPSHASVLDADPATVIVTLFRDKNGVPRGSYRLPPEISASFQIRKMIGEDDLLAPIAMLRGMQAAQRHGLELSVVDPGRLWLS